MGFSLAAVGFWWVELLVSVVAMAIGGVVIDAAIFRSLRKQDHMVTVLVTFGILLILETVVTVIWAAPSSDFSATKKPVVAWSVSMPARSWPSKFLIWLMLMA